MNGPFYGWIALDEGSLISDALSFDMEAKRCQRETSIEVFSSSQRTAFSHIVDCI